MTLPSLCKGCGIRFQRSSRSNKYCNSCREKAFKIGLMKRMQYHKELLESRNTKHKTEKYLKTSILLILNTQTNKMTEIMKTKKVMRERLQHIVICPRCKKEIIGYSIKQARSNYNIHNLTCKDKGDQNEENKK